MVLSSGRVIPNWILQSAFLMFETMNSVENVIEDVNAMLRDDCNKSDKSELSMDDALEIYKKFNSMQDDYDDVVDDFFEDHDMGEDEFDGDDDDDDNEDGNEPEGPGGVETEIEQLLRSS